MCFKMRSSPLAAALLLFSIGVAAQSTDWNRVKLLPPGTEVRVESGVARLQGKIRSVSDDSLIVRTAQGEEAIGRQQIKLLLEKIKGHRGKHILIGLGVGAAGGGLAGAKIGADLASALRGSVLGGAAAGAALVGAAGAVVGVGVGAALPSGSGWRPVYRQ